MLFINTKPELHIHRGDSFNIEAIIYSGNNLSRELYKFNEGDEIYFALLEPNQCWENAIVRKKFIENISQIELKPKDTMCLFPGLYYYQVKLKNKDGEVYTLCNRSKLYILE